MQRLFGQASSTIAVDAAVSESPAKQKTLDRSFLSSCASLVENTLGIEPQRSRRDRLTFLVSQKFLGRYSLREQFIKIQALNQFHINHIEYGIVP